VQGLSNSIQNMHHIEYLYKAVGRKKNKTYKYPSGRPPELSWPGFVSQQSNWMWAELVKK
jgi:hypothetical protein